MVKNDFNTRINIACALVAVIAVTLMCFACDLAVRAEDSEAKTYYYYLDSTQSANGHIYTQLHDEYSYTGVIAGYVSDGQAFFYRDSSNTAFVTCTISTCLVDELGNYSSNVGRTAQYLNYEKTSSSGEWTYKGTTNIPLFSTKAEMENYFLTGDLSGQINKPPKNIEDGILLEDMEIPRLYMVDGKNTDGSNSVYDFYITNATEDLNIEVHGRWYSIDDIEMYKENAKWKYKYYTTLKSELTTWVSYEDAEPSSGLKYFTTMGKTSFDDFLTVYPADSRSFFGGTNAIGNFFSNYTNTVAAMRTGLATMEYPTNSLEVYVRFWYEDETGIYFSKWCHWYNDCPDPAGSSIDDRDKKGKQSGKGLTDDEKDDLEDSDDSKGDKDIKIELDVSTLTLQAGLAEALGLFTGMSTMLGSFPQWLSTVFGFMLEWLVTILGLAIILCVVMRIAGR